MHGRDLFKIAVSAAVEDINIVLDEAGITPENVDYFLIHQSNKRMIDSIRHTMEQSVHKFPHNIEKYGNTSSASILILMDEMSRKSQLKKGDTLVLSAFGGGFTSGAMVITWNLNE
jgi:3-oxoacyl-[acyl-carrier-protein] synthase-3